MHLSTKVRTHSTILLRDRVRNIHPGRPCLKYIGEATYWKSGVNTYTNVSMYMLAVSNSV